MRTIVPSPSGLPSVLLCGRTALRTTSAPICRIRTSRAGPGRTRMGASGGPFFPQPASVRARQPSMRSDRRAGVVTSQDVTAEILVPDDVGEHATDIVGVDRDLPLRHVGGLEGGNVEQLLE